MSDITKCSGQNCPIKEKCYRFNAKSNEHWQSYFVDVPGKWTPNDENDTMVFECEMFWGEKNNITFEQLNNIFK